MTGDFSGLASLNACLPAVIGILGSSLVCVQLPDAPPASAPPASSGGGATIRRVPPRLRVRAVPEPARADRVVALVGAPDLVVVEEHVATGGVGERLARDLLLRGVPPRRFTHRHALGYPSGRYGSQAFHRRECGLDPAAILATLG
jgi:hypothetical protein